MVHYETIWEYTLNIPLLYPLEVKMAIVIRCKCKTEIKVSTKKYKNCDTIFGKKKTYKIIVRSRGKKVTRTVSNFSLAKEIESKLKVDIARGEHDLSESLFKPQNKSNIIKMWK
jgi:hypothetical protein